MFLLSELNYLISMERDRLRWVTKERSRVYFQQQDDELAEQSWAGRQSFWFLSYLNMTDLSRLVLLCNIWSVKPFSTLSQSFSLTVQWRSFIPKHSGVLALFKKTILDLLLQPHNSHFKAGDAGEVICEVDFCVSKNGCRLSGSHVCILFSLVKHFPWK